MELELVLLLAVTTGKFRLNPQSFFMEATTKNECGAS